MAEGRRMTQFREREDGQVERWVGREGGEMALDAVLDPKDYEYRPDDAYPARPPHIEGCVNIPTAPGPAEDVVAVVRCTEGCPVLAEGIRRGQELAKEYGW